MKKLNFFAAAFLIGALSFASVSRASADGLPVPWPFPWAKDCPIEWSAMAGRYLLSDSKTLQYIDIKITPLTKEGFKLVRVARYDQNSELMFDGFTYISVNQRTLRLSLMPTGPGQDPLWAVIKLHFQSNDLRCAVDQLVPILTLEPMDPKNTQVSRYKLVKVSNQK